MPPSAARVHGDAISPYARCTAMMSANGRRFDRARVREAVEHCELVLETQIALGGEQALDERVRSRRTARDTRAG